MVAGTAIRKNEYHDSVFLMRAARRISEQKGVLQAAAPGDLIIAVQAENAETLSAMLGNVEEWLRPCPDRPGAIPVRTLEEALSRGRSTGYRPREIGLPRRTARFPGSPPKGKKRHKGPPEIPAGDLCRRNLLLPGAADPSGCRDSNLFQRPLAGNRKLPGSSQSLERTLVDMGADEFTSGRPHPMIDSSQRRERILQEAQDPEVAVLLLDFILGFSASSDPAGDLAPDITRVKREARKRGGALCVVASVCGTKEDPQDYTRQAKLLEDAGAVVFPSSARAAQFCAAFIRALQEGPHAK